MRFWNGLLGCWSGRFRGLCVFVCLYIDKLDEWDGIYGMVW